jgi:hypothetical protein
MALAEMGLFKAAMRNVNSGRFQGNHKLVRKGRAGVEPGLGAYQISPSNWAKWTAQVGLRGADWRDPKAQEEVAEVKMRQLYNRYRDWRAVEVAWNYGTDAADEVARAGDLGPYAEEGEELVRSMRRARSLGYSNARVQPTLSVDAPMKPLELTALPLGAAGGRGRAREEYGGGPDRPAPRSTQPSSPGSGTGSRGGRPAPASPAPGAPPGPPTIIPDPATAAAAAHSTSMTPEEIERLENSNMHHNMAMLLQALSDAIKAGNAPALAAAGVDTGEAASTTGTLPADNSMPEPRPENTEAPSQAESELRG